MDGERWQDRGAGWKGEERRSGNTPARGNGKSVSVTLRSNTESRACALVPLPAVMGWQCPCHGAGRFWDSSWGVLRGCSSRGGAKHPLPPLFMLHYHRPGPSPWGTSGTGRRDTQERFCRFVRLPGLPLRTDCSFCGDAGPRAEGARLAGGRQRQTVLPSQLHPSGATSSGTRGVDARSLLELLQAALISGGVKYPPYSWGLAPAGGKEQRGASRGAAAQPHGDAWLCSAASQGSVPAGALPVPSQHQLSSLSFFCCFV